MRKSYYFTTAISYPNGAPHIGHAYEAMATDALARFQRLDGNQVFFLTGTDEHGLKMLQTARGLNMDVRDLAKQNSDRFEAMVKMLGCTNDDFIRTSEPRHYAACQAIWQKMLDKGDIYLSNYSGWYSVRDEAYYDENELTTREDGKKYAPTGTPVEWVEENSYFFRLSAYQDKLLQHYEANPDFIAPDGRRNEVVSFVKRGLKDLSISRTTFDWGVPVPNDPAHVMYVWVDALTNYLTGIGYPDTDSDTYKTFWPADVHVIGKDIVRFHAIYWPAFLMSADIPLPKRVFGHGFLLFNNMKMSKSDGNVLDPFDLVSEFGLDQVRYFFLREVNFGNDGNFNAEVFSNRVNADLANDFGNLAQRSLSMVAKNCGGVVPTPSDLTKEDTALLEAIESILPNARAAMDKQEIHNAAASVWAVVTETNRYFTAQEPWALKKTDPERMATVLYITLEAIRNLAILAQPFVPLGSEKFLNLVNAPSNERSFAHLGAGFRLKPGTVLPMPEAVFPRIELKKVGEGND